MGPISKPLAGKKLTKKLYKLVKKASGAKYVKRGVKEVVKVRSFVEPCNPRTLESMLLDWWQRWTHPPSSPHHALPRTRHRA